MSKKLIHFDWAIKNILRQKANFEILEGFLSELLYEDIKIQSILESEGNQADESDKYNRVDILTKNSTGELIVVEIQNNYEYDYFQRMVYGASKAVTEYLDAGESYSQVKKVISINIVYFNLGEGEDYIYEGVTEFKGRFKNDILEPTKKQQERFKIKTLSQIFPQYFIIKLGNFTEQDNSQSNDNQFDTLDEWLYFLKNSKTPKVCHAKGLKKAEKVLDQIALSEKQRRLYERYLDSLRVRKSEAESVVFMNEELAETKAEVLEMKGQLTETSEKLIESEKKLKIIEDEAKEKLKLSEMNSIKTLWEFGISLEKIQKKYPHFTESEILTLKN